MRVLLFGGRDYEAGDLKAGRGWGDLTGTFSTVAKAKEAVAVANTGVVAYQWAQIVRRGKLVAEFSDGEWE